MDNCTSGSTEKGKVTREKKHHPNALKDVKRKLSFMNKKISDHHHQRKFAYKNSVKVKKMVHNQVNQIIKCLRARERSLWADVDEAYIVQDASISEELSKLQSVYSRSQALFNHLDDFKGKTDVLSKIYSVLSEVNFGEKPDVKPLEFRSDFEAMKSKASTYGYLEGDFLKKNDSVFFTDAHFVDLDEKNNELVDGVVCDKEEIFDKTSQTCKVNTEVYKNNLDFSKDSDCEDFQIIDLLDNMCCHDTDDDYIMTEEKNLNCFQEIQKEFSGLPHSGSENKFAVKGCNSSQQSHEACEVNNDFNLEDEWKHLVEMNKKIASFREMTLTVSGEKQTSYKVQKTLNDPKNATELYDKGSQQSRFLLLKEAESWLHNSDRKKDALENQKTFEKINIEMNYISPVELIKKAFKPYLVKQNIQNWLSTN